MSNAQTRNAKKVAKLNQIIEAAAINRVANALENNHIKAVCNEIAYDPKILSAYTICRGQYLAVREHMQYTISILSESKLSKIRDTIDTLSDRHLKRIFSGLFPKPIESTEDELSIIPDTHSNRLLPELLFFKPAGAKSVRPDHNKSDIATMMVRIESKKSLTLLFTPSNIIQYEEDIDIKCDGMNPYEYDSALERSLLELSMDTTPSGQIAKFNAVDFV